VILATRGAVVGARGWRIARQAAGDAPAPVGAPKQRAARIARPAGSLGGWRGDQSRSRQPLRGRRPQYAPEYRRRHHSGRLQIERGLLIPPGDSREQARLDQRRRIVPMNWLRTLALIVFSVTMPALATALLGMSVRLLS
jgi:hypothetical protein